METLSEAPWDLIINGTGLQQSFLALALSRSDKKILHVDENPYYGGPSACFTLPEASSWAAENASGDSERVFRAAEYVELDGEKLGGPRSYALSLAPVILHCRGVLVKTLVDAGASRGINFQAVGSFFVYNDGALMKLPSTREDIFLNSVIPVKAKRGLMKFLKMVMDFESEENLHLWQPHATDSLEDFLESKFKLMGSLKAFVTTLTLSLDKTIPVESAIRSIHRHLSSMNHFGPGFAAVYPQYGGLAEITQVSCRALAVGGATYVLGTGVKSFEVTPDGVKVDLPEVTVTTKKLVTGQTCPEGNRSVTKAVVVLDGTAKELFVSAVEGGPTPTVVLVGFPAGSLGEEQEYPVYAMLHSSETGECPRGQVLAYLTTLTTPTSRALLQKAIDALSTVLPATPVAQLVYEQADGSSQLILHDSVVTMPCATSDLAFDDGLLDCVQKTWEHITNGEEDRGEFMKFKVREEFDDDD